MVWLLLFVQILLFTLLFIAWRTRHTVKQKIHREIRKNWIRKSFPTLLLNVFELDLRLFKDLYQSSWDFIVRVWVLVWLMTAFALQILTFVKMLPSSHYSDIFQNFHISDSEQYPPQIFLSSACQPVFRLVQESQTIACCSTVQYSTVQYRTVQWSHRMLRCCGKS